MTLLYLFLPFGAAAAFCGVMSATMQTFFRVFVCFALVETGVLVCTGEILSKDVVKGELVVATGTGAGVLVCTGKNDQICF